jgi:WD40 repeat protein
MTNPTTRHAARSGRRRLRIVLVTLAIVGLGWAGIGLDPASLNLDGWRWIVEAESPQPRLVGVFAHDGGIDDIAWSPDGRIAAGGVLHNALMLWDANTGALLRRFDREFGSISAVAWSPDGKYVAAGRWFTEVSLGHVAINVWDASTGRRLHALIGPLPRGQGANNVPARSLSFSPDSRLVAAGHRGAISIHEVETGQLKTIIRGHPAVGIVLAFSANGQLVATGGPDQTAPVQLFDVETGVLVRSFSGDRETPFALAYQPGRHVIATAEYRRPLVTLWDAETGHPVRDLSGHTAPIRALAYSSDGRVLASAAPGGGVIIWDAKTGERLASLPQPKDLVYSIAFSAGARYLAAPVDKQVRVWDLSRVLPDRS